MSVYKQTTSTANISTASSLPTWPHLPSQIVGRVHHFVRLSRLDGIVGPAVLVGSPDAGQAASTDFVAAPEDKDAHTLVSLTSRDYIRDRDDEVVLWPVLNRLCLEVRPMTVREYMGKFWTGT